jgi:hypothetical protein
MTQTASRTGRSFCQTSGRYIPEDGSLINLLLRHTGLSAADSRNRTRVNGEQKIVWKEAAYQLRPGTTETANEISVIMAHVVTRIPQIQSSWGYCSYFVCYLITLLTNALSYFVSK